MLMGWNAVKKSIILKGMKRQNEIPIKIPSVFLDKSAGRFYSNQEDMKHLNYSSFSKKIQSFLTKSYKTGEPMLPHFKVYYKLYLSRKCGSSVKTDKQVNERIESPKTDKNLYGQLIFSTKQKGDSMEAE